MERKHRHIVETGLTLLATAKLSLCYWDHAFLTATYLTNRLPSPTLDNRSPYFMLHLQFPDYKFFKSFGCSCFPFTRSYNYNKLEFRSKECKFLGYSPSHKGYKCLDSTGRLYISKDVLFNERRFPYEELFTCHQPSTTSDTSSSFTTFPIIKPPTNNTSSTTDDSSLPSSLPSGSTPTHITSAHLSPHHTTSSYSPSHHASHDNNLPPGPIFNPTPITTISPSSSGVISSPSQSHSNNTVSQHNEPASGPSPPHAPPHCIHPNNIHTMATRGKRGIVQQRIQPTLLLTHLEPTSYKQAMKHSDLASSHDT